MFSIADKRFAPRYPQHPDFSIGGNPVFLLARNEKRYNVLAIACEPIAIFDASGFGWSFPKIGQPRCCLPPSPVNRSDALPSAHWQPDSCSCVKLRAIAPGVGGHAASDRAAV